MMDRRSVLLGGMGLVLVASGASAEGSLPPMHVARDPQCGCCGEWVSIMQDAGFPVTTQDMFGNEAYEYALASGIPDELLGCHTARVAGYTVEGHVPVADVLRLLAERPDAVGLTVPGMPMGSPGMGPEEIREAYDVWLVHHDGSAEVFTQYPAA